LYLGAQQLDDAAGDRLNRLRLDLDLGGIHQRSWHGCGLVCTPVR
jgi:hypothetical protein